MDWLFPLERLFAAPELMLALVVGVVLGIVFGLLPGINGKKGIILSLPLLVAFDPLTAVVYLVAMHAVVHTCGTLPAVLVGIPTSTSEAAVVLDGYPLVRQGRAWEAIAATIAASAVGGLFGALALIALVPLGLMIVPYMGSAEIMGLTMLGLLAISSLSGSSLARGLIVAAFGLLAATIGFDNLTGTPRYTFGQLTLGPGLNVAALLAGLFVIPEMVFAKRRQAGHSPIGGMGIRDIIKGMTIAFRRIGIVARSSVIGIIVGFIPGIGSSVSVWMAYGHAVQTEPHDPPFGQGNVAGVLSTEAANNAKEGGAFAPTLMFSIPGTSSMAIMMLAFSYVGVDTGPRLVAQDPGFISLVGWIILIANLIAIPVCLAFVPTFSFIATLKQAAILPVAFILSTVAAVVVMPHPSSLAQMAVFGAIGTALRSAGWPRAPLLLGFVMGPILESTLSRTVAVYGWSALERPGVLVLLALGLVTIAAAFRRKRKKRAVEGYEPNAPAPALAGGLVGLFGLASYGALSFPPAARLFPFGAAILGSLCCFVVIVEDHLCIGAGAARARRIHPDPEVLLPMLGLLVATPLVGLPAATLGYVFSALLWSARTPWRSAAAIAVASACVAFLLGGDTIGLVRPFDRLWLWISAY